MLSWSWLLEVWTVSVADATTGLPSWSGNQYTVCRTAVWPRPVLGSVHTGPWPVCRLSCCCRGSDATRGAFVDCAVDVPSDARRDPSWPVRRPMMMIWLAWRHWPIGHTCVIVFRMETDVRLFVSNDYLSCWFGYCIIEPTGFIMNKRNLLSETRNMQWKIVNQPQHCEDGKQIYSFKSGRWSKSPSRFVHFSSAGSIFILFSTKTWQPETLVASLWSALKVISCKRGKLQRRGGINATVLAIHKTDRLIRNDDTDLSFRRLIFSGDKTPALIHRTVWMPAVVRHTRWNDNLKIDYQTSPMRHKATISCAQSFRWLKPATGCEACVPAFLHNRGNWKMQAHTGQLLVDYAALSTNRRASDQLGALGRKRIRGHVTGDWTQE